MSVFENMKFITPCGAFNPESEENNKAIVYQKTFSLPAEQEMATLYICAIGLGVCYLNGKRVGEDVLCAPVSNYEKTLWVMEYDVQSLLRVGENTITVITGNGYYNEGVDSVWKLQNEEGRDFPKVALRLCTDHICVDTDESWKCSFDSPIYYNQLRIGEYVDYRLRDASKWQWKPVCWAPKPPKGQFRLNECPSVRECEILHPCSIWERDGDLYVDFGRNISGYVRITADIPNGVEVKLVYAEKLDEYGNVFFGNMNNHFPGSEFQTDKIIGNGCVVTWSPLFTYHGFRYVKISGLLQENVRDIQSVFIHNDIPTTVEFSCSNKKLTQLYSMAVNSIYSNMHNMMTDCPTREKFGWYNDFANSVEFLVSCFDSKMLLSKMMQDALDSFKENGDFLALFPPCNWGYENCHGTVMASAVFEIAQQWYSCFEDVEGYRIAFAAFEKHLEYALKHTNEEGFVEQHYGLRDWAGPWPYDQWFVLAVPLEFTDSIVVYKCLKIAENAARTLGEDDKAESYCQKAAQLRQKVMAKYIGADGRCTLGAQSAVLMLISFGFYENLEPLKNQLAILVEKKDFHHDCGMITFRYLLDALDKCNLQNYAYRVLTAEGFPSYFKWMEEGETSLCETWQNGGSSRNHHMFSFAVMWLVKTLCGFQLHNGAVSIEPYFEKDISWASLVYRKGDQTIRLRWERCDERVRLTVENASDKSVQVFGHMVAPNEQYSENRDA